MTIKQLLDAVKENAGIATDYALAKELGVHRQLISAFYKGTRKPDNGLCREIAQRLHKPLGEVITEVEIEAEKNEQRREEWRRYYKSIGGLAASVALIVFTSYILIVTPSPANASIRADYATTHFVLCIVAMIFAYSNRQLQLRQIRLKPQFCISVI